MLLLVMGSCYHINLGLVGHCHYIVYIMPSLCAFSIINNWIIIQSQWACKTGPKTHFLASFQYVYQDLFQFANCQFNNDVEAPAACLKL